MTCRCTSDEMHNARQARNEAESRAHTRESKTKSLKARLDELQARSPDPDEFVTQEVESIGDYLIIKVQYPSCARCSYDQNKVLVLKAGLRDMVFWRRIDPHFSEEERSKTEAPSPIARFPASPAGWTHALAFVRNLSKAVSTIELCNHPGYDDCPNCT